MNQERKLPPCGNPECACSSDICDGMTFGSGELDHYGFWEKPCQICARNFDATRKERRAKLGQKLKAEGRTNRQIRKYIATADWLWLRAWPYPPQNTNLKAG